MPTESSPSSSEENSPRPNFEPLSPRLDAAAPEGEGGSPGVRTQTPITRGSHLNPRDPYHPVGILRRKILAKLRPGIHRRGLNPKTPWYPIPGVANPGRGTQFRGTSLFGIENGHPSIKNVRVGQKRGRICQKGGRSKVSNYSRTECFARTECKDCHEFLGHVGPEKLWALMGPRYCWADKGLARKFTTQVGQICPTCQACQRPKALGGPLRHTPIPPAPMVSVALYLFRLSWRYVGIGISGEF